MDTDYAQPLTFDPLPAGSGTALADRHIALHKEWTGKVAGYRSDRNPIFSELAAESALFADGSAADRMSFTAVPEEQ